MKRKNTKNETKKLGYNKRLMYLAVAVAAIIIVVGLFFHIYSSYPSRPKAAVIDQLSSFYLSDVTRYENTTFVNRATELLHERFSKVDYYSNNATVDQYKRLSSENYKLIIWRAHSALDLDSKYIAISTSERYYSKDYSEYIENGQLTVCNITGDLFYGITPKFTSELMSGRFEDTVIIFMSCNGLKQGYESTAETFHEKGVKVFISWDGWIEPSFNDYAIALLLDYLIGQNNTIQEAVNKIPHSPFSPIYGSSILDYYPNGDSEVANYRIPDYKQNSAVSSMGIVAILTFRRKSVISENSRC